MFVTKTYYLKGVETRQISMHCNISAIECMCTLHNPYQYPGKCYQICFVKTNQTSLAIIYPFSPDWWCWLKMLQRRLLEFETLSLQLLPWVR